MIRWTRIAFVCVVLALVASSVSAEEKTRIGKIEMQLSLGASTTYVVTFAGNPTMSDTIRAKAQVVRIAEEELDVELARKAGENISVAVTVTPTGKKKPNEVTITVRFEGGRFDRLKGI